MSALLVFLVYFASSVLGVLHGRDMNAPLLDSYDYIICGCGISGLVVANRLSEDASVDVLCIEAGLADHYEAIIQVPVYVGDDIGGIYDWDLETVPQTQLDGATRPMPQGKVVGGGSILNAMCWNRGGQDDYDAWESLGNPGWGWDGMLAYFMKSETYTPVYSEEIAEEYSINYNPNVHGFSGPVQVSYPKYFYPQSINFFEALNYLGVPTEFDQGEGSQAGASFVPTDLDPNNQTRSDARRTYYDPYATRPNYHIITGQHVTQLIIEGISDDPATTDPTSGGDGNGDGADSGDTGGLGFGPGAAPPPVTAAPTASGQKVRRSWEDLRILGVEFAPNATAPRQTVYATREVIVAAGSLHSTQLLELSGIGPAALLEQLNITVAIDLPGVGNNLQDHCLVGTFYPYNNASYPSPTELTTNATYDIECEGEYYSSKTGPWTAGSPNALAFPPLPLISNNTNSILLNASSQNPTEYLLPNLDSTVIEGYIAQRESVIQRLNTTTSAAYEIINNNAGSLTVSVMHPLSRGVCYINSPDPFEPPLIDPRWLSDPTDRSVLVEALKFNRQILASPSMVLLQAAQFVPPVDADEDALNQVINNGIRTEFHPSGTLAMLPLERGGVVDSNLLVYGTQNLRVVDASIFPLIPAAHLQAVVYAVAEKAADIIKGVQVFVETVKTPTSTSTPASAQTPLPVTTQDVNPSTINYAATFTSVNTPSPSPQLSSTLSSSVHSLTSTLSTGQTIIATLTPPLLSSIGGYNQSRSLPVFGDVISTTKNPVVPAASTSSILSLLGAVPTIILLLPTVSPSSGPYSQILSLSSVARLSAVEASISSAVVDALTSTGIPLQLASTYETALAATLSPTSTVAEDASNPLSGGNPSEQALVAEFIQWLITFFHLDG